MIHGGLQINLKSGSRDVAMVNQCCLVTDLYPVNISDKRLWNLPEFEKLKNTNNFDERPESCKNCNRIEQAGEKSLRLGMLDKFGEQYNLSGPLRLDLMFDISCNLACRICGPGSSTLWQKHLKEHNIPFVGPSAESGVKTIISALKKLDLSNLGMVVFCGGETLMGHAYWKVAEAIADLVPTAKEKITLCFQTNGTQPIDKRYYEIIDRFHLVKLHVSVDGVEEQFEYQRWPAKWSQVTENLFSLRENLPVNTMFLVEETVSIFNLFYLNRLETWLSENFKTNRLGDVINHTRHMAYNTFALSALTDEYVGALPEKNRKLVSGAWKENPAKIKFMLAELDKIDKIRNQNWRYVFPELVEFYSRYQ